MKKLNKSITVRISNDEANMLNRALVRNHMDDAYSIHRDKNDMIITKLNKKLIKIMKQTRSRLE